MNKGIIVNEDCHYWLCIYGKNITKDFSQKELLKYIDRYKNTCVTDIMFNVNGSISIFPSRTRTSAIDKYYITEELEKPVNYKDDPAISMAHFLWIEKKIDMFEIWINRCYENNINPWISFRMNDIHSTFDEELPNSLQSSFFYEHYKNYARITYRQATGYYDRCMDYKIPEVQQHNLDYINETLEKYDPYGIELDFQREMLCFAIGEEQEGYKHLLDFIIKVKKITDTFSKKRGHTIKIALRCMPSPIDNIELGLDICDLDKKGLIDMVVPSPRWGNTKYDFPIKLWKQLLKSSTILAPCTEVMVKTNPYSPFSGYDLYHTPETLAGCAVSILSDDADKFYVFNLTDYPQRLLNNQNSPIFNSTKHINEKEILDKIYPVLGDLEKAINVPRRHPATCEDFTPPWRNILYSVPKTSNGKNDVKYIKISTGFISPKSKISLKIAISEKYGNSDNLNVYLNGIILKCFGKKIDGFPRFTQSPVYTYEIKNNGNMPKTQIIEFVALDKPITIDHAEITVNI